MGNNKNYGNVDRLSNCNANNPDAITVFTFRGHSECLFLSQPGQSEQKAPCCALCIKKKSLSIQLRLNLWKQELVRFLRLK